MTILNKHARCAMALVALTSVGSLSLVCSSAVAQPASDKAGSARAGVNPFIESLTVAKDTVVATTSRLVGSEAPAPSNSSDPATPAVTGAASIKAPKAPKAPNAPQMKPLAANPVQAPTVDTEGAINPLSGKLVSEEQLMRVLNANKLVTEIGRQQVEQAKNLVELNKAAADARQIESAKQRSDAVNVSPKTLIRPVKIDESLSRGEQVISGGQATPGGQAIPGAQGTLGWQGTSGAAWQSSQTSWSGTGVSSGGGLASGTVQIGTERFAAQSRSDGHQARVIYVDSQPAKNQAPTMGSFGTSTVPAPVLPPLPDQMMR